MPTPTASKIPPGLSIVIATYKGTETLPEVVRRIETQFEADGTPLELIIVNDGDQSGSWPMIQALALDRPWVTGINLARNYGQHNALLCGVRLARHPRIVTMDDDSRHLPEDIPRLLAVLDSGADVVYGVPREERRWSWRVAGSVGLGLLLLAGHGGARRYSSFRAFKAWVREPFMETAPTRVCLDVLLDWSTGRFGEVSLKAPGVATRSRYRLRGLLSLATLAILGFNLPPPGLIIGLGLTLFTLALVSFQVASRAPGDVVLAVTLGLTGLQICVLGWLGILLKHIWDGVSGRPPYVIADRTPPPMESAPHADA